jgi:hypothetical protein
MRAKAQIFPGIDWEEHGKTMDEIAKIAVWPIAFMTVVLVLALIFRKELGALIGRISGFKVAGTAVDASGQTPEAAVQQQKEARDPAQIEMVPATHAMPPADEAYAAMEQQIRTALEAAKLPSELERAWLLRAIAFSRFQHAYEVNYRVILGSQINLVLLANTPAPPNIEGARQLYENAKQAYPDLEKSFSFDAWLEFPLRAGLVRMDGTLIRTTPAGRNFLKYLVDTGLTSAKVG